MKNFVELPEVYRCKVAQLHLELNQPIHLSRNPTAKHLHFREQKF